MKVLHIANYSVRMKGYIERVNNNFDREAHAFYIVGSSHGKDDEINADNVTFEDSLKDNWTNVLQKMIDDADRIVLHSIDSKNTVKLNMYIKAQQKGKSIVWAVWGHDVYDAYWRAHRFMIKHPINFITTQYQEHLRKKLIKDISYIMAIPGDYDSIKTWYKTDARYILFNQISYGEQSILSLPVVNNEKLKVVVGHDAYPHCRHKETFDILKKYDNGNIEVYCPLPYNGEMPLLVKNIIDIGKNLFGNRFIPVTEYVNYSQYCKFVNSMDVALYNHNRQMAEGNVLMFLYYGKKVFVSKENCIGAFFKGLGADIYSMDELNEKELFEKLDNDTKLKNKNIIEYNLSDEAFKKVWEEAFDSIL